MPARAVPWLAARLLVLFLAVFVTARAADGVIPINGLSHMEAVAKEHPFLVVEVYAPWCGHCKRLEPEYAKAAAALKDHDPPITLCKVDATAKENEKIKTHFQVSGFPTIKIVRDGRLDSPEPYGGPRDAAGIVQYLKKQAMPAVSQLTSKEEVAAARADSEVLVLGFFKDNETADFKTFASVADQQRNDMDFRYVTHHSLLEECSGSDCSSPFVVMYKKGEAEAPRYSGEFTADLLQSWTAAKALPLVIKFGSPSSMKHVQKAFGSSLPRLVVVVKRESPELLEQLQNASKASDDLTVILAVEGAESKRLIDHYGLQVGEGATLLLEDPTTAAKYLRPDAKPSDVPEFLREFSEGALERWVKSQEPPARNDGPVRVVTGKTFEAEVFGSGKDVFIEFYAPWCGHCKKLAPIWEEVGKALKGDPNVVIAQLDATTNDIPTPKISVRSYPTLVFVNAKGEISQYSGTREKKQLLEFVASKRTTGPPANEDEVDDEQQEAKEEL